MQLCIQSGEYNYRTQNNSTQSSRTHAVLIKLAADITNALFYDGFMTLQVDVHKFLIKFDRGAVADAWCGRIRCAEL